MPNDIGATLKKLRTNAGLSVKEVSDILISKGFKAGESTVYSWENNNSQPTPGALLTMCKAYKVDNVLSAFGYEVRSPNESPRFSDDEINMVKKHRHLDEHGKKVVTMLLDEEYIRCTAEEQEGKVIEFSLVRGSGRLVARNGQDPDMDARKEIKDIVRRWDTEK